MPKIFQFERANDESVDGKTDEIQDENFERLVASCQAVYRMGGLRDLLNFLTDILRKRTKVVRGNVIFAYDEGHGIINMADTSYINVSNKYASGNTPPPLLLAEKFYDSVIVDNLEPYKNDNFIRSNEEWSDTPFLKHASLLRIPVRTKHKNALLFNFWSDTINAFSKNDLIYISEILKHLSDEFLYNLSGMYLSGKESYISSPSGLEKLSICTGLADIRKKINRISKIDSNILIIGETGVGKEIVSDAICELSDRNKEVFIKVNCGAISEDLIDSLLFGHEKGSFTGAFESHKGYFEQADGGTLFLDEIGELTLAAQIRLLRLLENKMVTRVGGTKNIHVNVRVIAAAHEDIIEKVRNGQFRKDLWYRLAVITVRIPPLRERKEDIPILIRYFMNNYAHKLHIKMIPSITEDELNRLRKYSWPGNVRELEHVVERSLLDFEQEKQKNFIFVLQNQFLIENLDDKENKDFFENMTYDWPTLEELSNRYIKKVINHCSGKLTGTNSATAILDIHYSTLKSKIKKIECLNK